MISKKYEATLSSLSAAIYNAANYMRNQGALKSIAKAVDIYRAQIGGLVQSLLRGGGRMSKGAFRSQFKKAIADNAPLVWREGWIEGDGDPEDIGREESDTVDEFIQEQQVFVNDFSDWLTSKDADLDEATDRLDTWAASMKNLGELAKARAMGDPPLTYKTDGRHSEVGCDECDEYEGQTHKLSWWEDRGLTKRNGNDNFGCGRWGPCPHHFYHSKTGKLVIE